MHAVFQLRRATVMMWIQLPSQCLAKFEYCKVKLEGLNKSLPALKDWCANKFNSPGPDQGLGCTDPGCNFSERCCRITSQS